MRFNNFEWVISQCVSVGIGVLIWNEFQSIPIGLAAWYIPSLLSDIRATLNK